MSAPLTPDGEAAIADLSARYRVSEGAVRALLDAVVRGGGAMAQFSHPDLGGSGQWMRGGMTMVGDMFNPGLQSTVSGICTELASRWAEGAPLLAGPVRQAGSGSFGVPGGQWWPEELGRPSSSGGQNDTAYAYFPAAGRLAIRRGSEITVYDTADHAISGVQQQQGGRGSLEFTSQLGTFTVDTLTPATAAPVTAAPVTGSPSAGGPPSEAQPVTPRPARTQYQSQSSAHTTAAVTGTAVPAPGNVTTPASRPAGTAPTSSGARPPNVGTTYAGPVGASGAAAGGRGSIDRDRDRRRHRDIGRPAGQRIPDRRGIHREEDRIAGAAVGEKPAGQRNCRGTGGVGVGAVHAVIDSPVGELTLVGPAPGVLSGVYYPGHVRRPVQETFGERDDLAFEQAASQLAEYFDRNRTTFDLLVAPRGNQFQRKVWSLLTQIPYGATRTYGQLAGVLGDPGLARAVGAANGQNPLSIIVPCHRVVGSTGRLTGYAGGLERKAFLLDLETSDADRSVRLF